MNLMESFWRSINGIKRKSVTSPMASQTVTARPACALRHLSHIDKVKSQIAEQHIHHQVCEFEQEQPAPHIHSFEGRRMQHGIHRTHHAGREETERKPDREANILTPRAGRGSRRKRARHTSRAIPVRSTQTIQAAEVLTELPAILQTSSAPYFVRDASGSESIKLACERLTNAPEEGKKRIKEESRRKKD